MGVNCYESIQTGPDRLLQLVNSENELSLSKAANTLQVDEGAVEAWAELLEECNMIVVKMNLREKLLLSKEWNETTISPVQTLMKHVQSFSIKRPQKFNEAQLNARIVELRKLEKQHVKRAKLLENKLKDVKIAEEKAHKAEEALAMCQQEKRALEEKAALLDKKFAELTLIKSEVIKREQEASAMMQRAVAHEKQIAMKEQEVLAKKAHLQKTARVLLDF